MHNRLPTHTRLGTYITMALLLLFFIFMLRNCASALYYGAITNDLDISRSYQSGFADGQEQSEHLKGQPKKHIANPLLLKMYRKGFRDSRDKNRCKDEIR